MNFEPLYRQFQGKKNHGIVCPLFFLKTAHSSQIGEYPDLAKLAEFAHSCGFSIIQLLPLFDTGPEASPYSARSCFALNPIFLSLKALGVEPNDPDFVTLYTPTPNGFFDYFSIYTLKMKLLERHIRDHKQTWLTDPAFSAFCQNNPWLKSYSAFCIYKLKTETLPQTWDIDSDEIIHAEPQAFFFHQVLQYLCHSQFMETKKRCDSLGISLMGDIPILLSPDSVEMWTHRQLFDFQLTVGAPPDQYAADGQSWGFPMIRFVAKPQACAHFWRSRIDHVAPYFSLYRIDHAVGFFRLWTIPLGKRAKNGFFFPADEESALSNAKNLFEQLFHNTPLTPIAEDLGAIPPFVKKFISDSRLCGTKVVRWEKLSPELFTPLKDYPLFSLTTLSTHDSTFMFQEWSRDPLSAQTLAKSLELPYSPTYTPSLQEKILEKVHKSGSLFIINMIQEYLYLHPLYRDHLFRVNDPSMHAPTNWTMQMIHPLERLLEDSAFCHKLHTLLHAHTP